MIRCHLARLLGERKLKIAQVARATEINRGTLTRLYYERWARVDMQVLEQLCRFLHCQVGDLLEYIENPGGPGDSKGRARSRKKIGGF